MGILILVFKSYWNCELRYMENGVKYEPDQRHAEIIIASVGAKDSKPSTTPGATSTRMWTQSDQSRSFCKAQMRLNTERLRRG